MTWEDARFPATQTINIHPPATLASGDGRPLSMGPLNFGRNDGHRLESHPKTVD